MLSESSQVSKQSDALANPFFPFPMILLGRINHVDIYVGVVIMTLGYLRASHVWCSQCDDSGHHSRKHLVMLFSQQVFYSWVLNPRFTLLTSCRQCCQFLQDISNLCDIPRGPWYFLLPNTMNYLWQKFLVELKYHNRIILDEFSTIYCGSASSTFLHGLSGRNMLNFVRHAKPCIHNSENRMFLWARLITLIVELRYSIALTFMLELLL